MSDQPFKDWTSLWSDAQQQYWNTLQELGKKAMGQTPPPAANPWAEGFEAWSKLLQNAAPADNRDWFLKLAETNKAYLSMGEQFWKLMNAQSSGAPLSPENWWAGISEAFKNQAGSAFFGATPKDPWAAFASTFGLPSDQWQKLYAASSSYPEEFQKFLQGFMTGSPSENPYQKFLTMPALGYSRESQEQLQKLQQQWLKYGEALQGYNQVLGKITEKAFEIFGNKTRDIATGSAPSPESLRAIYNLWVDSGEEAYAEFATTPEFTKAQAGLVNALMAVKQQEQILTDGFLGQFGLPTRRELDTAHQRIHQLQRQVRSLQEAQADSGIQLLREEVAALKREIEGDKAKKKGAASAASEPKTL